MGKKIKLESVFYYPNPVFDFLKKILVQAITHQEKSCTT